MASAAFYGAGNAQELTPDMGYSITKTLGRTGDVFFVVQRDHADRCPVDVLAMSDKAAEVGDWIIRRTR